MEAENQKLEEPDLTGTYTARDYITWKSEELMELIRGKIFKMTPSPLRKHQQVSARIFLLIGPHFSGPCEAYYAPLDVYLIHPGEDWKETKNIFQPDLFVVCDPEKLHDRGCIGAPDLVVEILSSGTAKKDLGLKRDLYEEYGVKELWIVHPNDGTVAVHVLENGKYHILPIYAKGQILQSPTFPNLKFDLDEVFSGIDLDSD